MAAVNPKVYLSILKVRRAYPFDIAGLLMRFYAYMMSIGTVSMLSLSGYSFLKSGIIASLIAFSIFLFSPRISKLVDEFGQSRVVPLAAVVVICGLTLMLGTVLLHGPDALLFFAALLMGCIPNAQALVRARWTYLLRTGKLGADAPDIRTVFSYEGVLDDIAFMVSPPFAIAIGAAVIPIAGLLVGGISFIIGVILLTSARSTEPSVGWSTRLTAADAPQGNTGEGTDEVTPANDQNKTSSRASRRERSHTRTHTKSIIATSPVVRILFMMMFLAGGFFGIFDSTSVAFSEQLGDPNIAGRGLMASSLISATMGFLFGMISLRASVYKQLMVSAIALGLIFSSMMLIESEVTFYIVSCVGALSYAPFLIVLNSACERAVPGDRLTEAITWVNSGMTCGVAMGPTAAGVLIDTFGSFVSFDCAALVALCIPVIAIFSYKTLKRSIRNADADEHAGESNGEGEDTDADESEDSSKVNIQAPPEQRA